jgi:uncharacterized protein
MLRPSIAAILAQGQALFNERRFWDAHDVWEEAWGFEDGDVRRMFRGLLQVTTGYHKAFVRRLPSGAVALLSAGLESLAPIPDGLGGLRLAEFRARVAPTLEEARRWQRGECGAVSLALVPTLESDPAGR